MKKSDIIEQFEILRRLEPDASFVEQTRNMLLATAKPASLPSLQIRMSVWAWSVGAAVLLLTLVGINTFFLSGTPALSSSLDSHSLEQELQELSFNLQEVTYRQGVNQTIASALTEISDTRINHLNQHILKSEEQSLDVLGPENGSDIDRLLNQVIF